MADAKTIRGDMMLSLAKNFRGADFYPVQVVLKVFPSLARASSEMTSNQIDTTRLSRAEVEEILDIELSSVGELAAELGRKVTSKSVKMKSFSPKVLNSMASA